MNNSLIKKISRNNLFRVTLLVIFAVSLLSSCKFKKINNDANQSGIGAMQGMVFDKKVLTRVVPQQTSFLGPSNYHRGYPVMNGKQYSKYVETGGDGSIVETIGKNETVQTLDLNNYSRLLAQTNTEKIFSPFWYSGKWIKSDYRLRYILVVNIKDVHRKLAVSKNMYQQAKLGDYINVFKTKFKIIQEK